MAAEEYWRRYLLEATPCFLPPHYTDVEHHEKLHWRSYKQIWDRRVLEKFCAKHNVSLSALIHVAWSLVLAQSCGDDRVCFYSTTIRNGRSNDGVYRTRFQTAQLINDFLRSVQADLDSRQQYSIPSRDEMQNYTGDISGTLFDTSITIHERQSTIGGQHQVLELEQYPSSEQDKLTIEVTPVDEAINIVLHYTTPTVSAAQAFNMANALGAVIQSILDEPYNSVHEMSVTSQRCENQLEPWISDLPPTQNSCLRPTEPKQPNYSKPIKGSASYVSDPVSVNRDNEVSLTYMEKQLQQLWSKTLRREFDFIGPNDSFFRLGGDSITAIRLVSAAAEVGILLTFATICRNPELRSMASMATRDADSLSVEEDPPPFSLMGDLNRLQELLLEVSSNLKGAHNVIQNLTPCTPLQEGLMALGAKAPGAYVFKHVYKVPKDIDIGTFRAAWQIVANDTPILRTAIVDTPSQGSVQVIFNTALNWHYGKHFNKIVGENSYISMQYGDPLVRFDFIDDDEDSYLALSMHSAIYDRWSIQLLFEDVERAYRGDSPETRPPFTRVLKYMSDSDSGASDDYWRAQFADSNPVEFPKLSTPHYSPTAEAVFSQVLPFQNDSEREFLPATLIAASWAIVVGRYSESSDIVFGMTQSGRSLPVPGIADVPGPTTATVPVRIRLDGTISVPAFLRDIQDNAVESIPFQYAGLQNIRALDASCQDCCNFQNLLVINPDWKVEGSSLGLQKIDVKQKEQHPYGLVLECNFSNNSIGVCAQYDETLIPEHQIRRLVGHFGFLLEQLTSAKGSIQDLNMFSTADLTEVQNWNSIVPKRLEKCVHEVIENRAEVRPEAAAICAWDGNYTYQELDSMSSRLASHLHLLGVGPEVSVPICMEKSAWTVVAMLAILKAGGAFVPLDRESPASRIRDLILETDAKIVLASPLTEKTIREIAAQVVVICPSFIRGLSTSQAIIPKAKPSNPMYIIFTSGSTGKPKGVVVEHEAASSSFSACGNQFGLNESTRVFQFTAYTFDASILEIFSTLFNGGCVCIPSDTDRMGGDVARIMNYMNVTWSFFTPSMVRLIHPDDVPSLRVLGLGGEALDQAHINMWYDKVRLVCGYGPSECCIVCSFSEIDQNSLPGNIGTAAGAISWIVDSADHDRLAPVGTIGELLIEGPSLARGYLNDQDKTRASFIVDPLWTSTVYPHRNTPTRLYKTGDLVKYEANGDMMFVGRKDSQVKLYGRRIEVGEIEYVLKSNSRDSTEIVVEIITPARSPDKRLLAAFVCNKDDFHPEGPSDDIVVQISDVISSVLSKLEDAASQSLPAYMIPTLYIPITIVPTTTSGKADRKLLRSIATNFSQAQLEHYALAGGIKRPVSSEFEIQLQDLWATALKVPSEGIGADDNFFRIGGDSLSAMRLVTLARERGLRLLITDIFKNPQLYEMAQLMKPNGANGVKKSVRYSSEVYGAGHHALSDASLKDLKNLYAISPANIISTYPCTPLQEGLMAVTFSSPGAYTNVQVYRLPASLDLDRFRSAWTTVIAQTPILCTRIVHKEESNGIQVVLDVQPQWSLSQDLQTYLEEDARVPMSYGDALARYAIVEESDMRYFVWTAHHAIYDGTSFPIMLNRVEQAYEGEAITNSPPFSVFIKYLQSIDQKQSDEFWRSYLGGFEPVSFPHTMPWVQPAVDSSCSHTVYLAKMKTGITVSAIIRSAWAMIVSRYSETDDVVFAVTTSGRNVPLDGIEQIIGPTITTMPVRVTLDATESVEELLTRVQIQAAETIEFEHAGIQHLGQLSPDIKAACKSQNLLVIQPAEQNLDSVLGMQPINTSDLKQHPYALVVQCTCGDDRIDVDVAYDSSVLNGDQAKRIMKQFEHVLQQLALEQNFISVGEIDIVSPEDLTELWEWNAHLPKKSETCVQDVIQKQATLHPQAEAVCSWDMNLTYKELMEISMRLAIHLTQLGVGPGHLIPLCFEKSAWTIVAMLGILKAGGAFVPLDASHPIERLHAIIQDTGAKVVLTSAKFAGKCAGAADIIFEVSGSTIDIMEKFKTASNGRTTLIASRVKPSDVAYVIYTSGTTGKPKGIMIEHSAFCTAASENGPAMLMRRSSRILQFASYSFDACLSEILTGLMTGACVCVPNDHNRSNDLTGVIRDFNVNWMLLTPSVARTVDPEGLPRGTTLVLGGEAMSEQDISTWAHRVDLVNAYGPSECSVVASVNSRITKKNEVGNIGHAVGSLSWITDVANSDRLSPIGCVGEIVFEGASLARGYLHNDEKTSEAFINSPKWLKNCGPERQRRLYRTGDLGRYNSDGTISFVGRKDNQIKLRGQRIELAEIEHQIMNTKHVDLAAVVFPKSGPCAKRLVAVLSLVGIGNPSPDDNEIEIISSTQREAAEHQIALVREIISGLLPEFMVPTIWVPIKKVPLSKSLKTDKNLVQGWIQKMSENTYGDIQGLGDALERNIPTTPAELMLQKVLSKVLNIPQERVSLTQSFIRLGGDSISAMQTVTRCAAENYIVAVQDILRSKTVAEIAMNARVSDSKSSYVVKEEQFDIPFGLSPIQKVYFKTAAIQSAGYDQGAARCNQSFFLRINRHVSVKDMARAVEALVTRHSMLRARFQYEDSWVQKIISQVSKSYCFATYDLRNLAEAIPVIESLQTSLDVSRGPLFTAALFNVLGDKQHIVLIAHHLIIDLVSWRIILQDLEELLESRKLPAVTPFPFQAWCALQDTYAQKYLDPKAALPYSITQSANFDYWGMTGRTNKHGDTLNRKLSLSKDITAKLLGNCRDSMKVDVADILLGALLHSFAQVFEDRTLPTAFSEGHGREPWDSTIDLASTVGWFTTMYPLPLDVEEKSKHDLVQYIRLAKDTRKSLPGNGWPYFASRFFNAAGIEAFSTHSAMEILFNFQGSYQQLEREGSLFQQSPLILPESAGDLGVDLNRVALFDVSAVISSGVLDFEFSYNRNMNHQDKIIDWTRAHKDSLESAVEQLSNLDLQLTLADLPLLPLTYDGLDILLNQKLPQIGILDLKTIEDIYPCSPIQQGMLYMQAKQPSSYSAHSVHEIAGRDSEVINVSKLQQAWQAVVNRHPLLRTLFMETVAEKGLFDQVVLKDLSANFTFVDCVEDNAGTTLVDQQGLKHRMGELPYKFSVCKDSSDKVFCRVDINHAIFDGHSLSLLLNDLSLAYEDRLLLDKGPKYSDYIKYLQGCQPESAISYYRQYLADVDPCYFPVLNDNHGDKSTTELHEFQVELDDNLVQKAYSFCEEKGFTISNVMQAVWGMVLRCYTGSEQVCFGYLVSGRDVPVIGIEQAVGPYINALVCSLSVKETIPLEDIVQEARNGFIESQQFQYFSIAEIQHALGLNSQALFNTGMSFQRPTAAPEDSALSYNVLTDHDPNEYDISVHVTAPEDGLEVYLKHWTHRISSGHARHIAACFSHCLHSIVNNPSVKIADVDLVNTFDKKQISKWNSVQPEAIDACAHDFIRKMAIQQPDAVAVFGWDGTFTYDQLDHQAECLAHHLVELGVGPEVIVPLCFEKSIWSMLAILSVMKAGGAFVFLDPSFPMSRHQDIIEQVQPRLILASKNQSVVWKELDGFELPIITVDSSNIQLLISPTRPLPQIVSPQNALYVVFTSGSTGRPKGCVIEHASFLSGAFHQAINSRMTKSSRVLQFASYTFDVSILEMITGLLVGACVCIPGADMTSRGIAATINEFQATWAFLTPSLLKHIKPEEVKTLESLVLGGEALSKTDVETWASKVWLLNGYGPSECSIAAACNPGLNVQSDPVNIGRAIGCTLWIANPDNHHHLVSIGAIGELLIEGPILARGYLNNQEKENEVFIEDPDWTKQFAPVLGRSRRFYKTGDLVQYTSEGSVRFLGRKDTQVKLRGQRIELGEIEHNLAVNPLVGHCMVLLPKIGFAKKRLVAVMSLKSVKSTGTGTPLKLEVTPEIIAEVGQIFQYLSQKLPAFMVPSSWAVVQEIPLMPSGKMDRTCTKNWLDGMDQETYEKIAELGSFSTQSTLSKLEAHETVALKINEMVVELVAADDERFANSIRGRDIILTQAGIDSINVITLSNFVRKTFDVKLPIYTYSSSSATIRSIAEQVIKGSASDVEIEKIDLFAEFKILNDELLQIQEPVDNSDTNFKQEAEVVFVTGGTGFLGTQIIRKLLETPTVKKVIALARAKDDGHAKERLIETAKKARWWRDNYEARLEGWMGDLARPKLGLSEENWRYLNGGAIIGNSIDAIIHNGAVVHWEADFAALRPANVLSTVELLSLMSRLTTPPRFTFVTGGHISVEDVTDEELSMGLADQSGYGQTKFLSELLIKEYAKRSAGKGHPYGVSIIKPGLIIGTADEGVSNTDDFLWRVISTAIKIGGFNGEDKGWLMFAGGDQVAGLTIDSCFRNSQSLEVVKILDGIPVEKLWTLLAGKFHYGLYPQDAEDWLRALQANITVTGETHPLFPVFHFLESTAGFIGVEKPPADRLHFSEAAVMRSVERSIAYLAEIGYLGGERNADIKPASVFKRSTVVGRTL